MEKQNWEFLLVLNVQQWKIWTSTQFFLYDAISNLPCVNSSWAILTRVWNASAASREGEHQHNQCSFQSKDWESTMTS